MTSESINTVAVLGLGTMGHAIAQRFAMGGFTVHTFDADPAARDSAMDRIHSNLQQMAAAELVTITEVDRIRERVVVHATERDAAAEADFITEAVAESLSVKQELFQRLESIVSGDTILASNSSSFPMSQTAERMKNPARAILTHWFNPPHIVPVVEVVPGKQTSETTIQLASDVLKRIGKIPVTLRKEIPGFLVNRVQIAMYREIWDLLERGVASAEEIDTAIRGSMGMRLAALGPLAINDYAGLDITAAVYQNLIPDMRSSEDVPESITSRVAAGHYGAKTMRGIYDYTAESLAADQAERDRRYLALIKLLF